MFDLLKCNAPFIWRDKHEIVYNKLKELLTSDQVLSFPNVWEEFNLYTDASKVGMGSVLCQYSDTGDEKVIQYFSKKFSPVQTRYSTIEREALALISSLKEFRPYLAGGTVNVYTDHKPLLSLFKKDIKNDRIQRWKLEISDYSCNIRYLKGSINHCPDFLSRLLVEVGSCDYVMLESSDGVMKHIPLVNDKIPLKGLVVEQQRDFKSLFIKKEDNLIVHNNVLYSIKRPTRLDLKYPRLMLPIKYRRQVMENAHKSICHQGIHKTLDYIRQCYVWPGMRRDITSYIAACPACQLNTKFNVRKYHHRVPHRNVRNSLVSMDITGPFMVSPNGNKYILSIIDHTTRWIEFIPLKNKTAVDITEAFYNNWICRYGIPFVLLTDNALEFKANVLYDLCKKLHIQRRFSSFYNPTSQGKNERVHASIKGMIRKMIENDTSQWENQLHPCLYAYRVTIHKALGVSPFYLQFGDWPNLPFTQFESDQIEGSNYYKHLTAAFQIAKEETRKLESSNATGWRRLQMKNHLRMERL
jgi:hypothetical protein